MGNLTNVDIYFRFFIAFGIILALIGLATWAARFLGFSSPLSLRNQRQKRLSIVDVMALDAKRRLVLISRDGIEHLVCIGGSNDFIVENNIKSAIPSINKEIVEELQSTFMTNKAS